MGSHFQPLETGPFRGPLSAVFVPLPPLPPPDPATLLPGMLAVTDSPIDRIKVFHPNGTLDFEFGGRHVGANLTRPQAAVYSPDGTRIAVSDPDNGLIKVFDAATGSPVFAFGSNGSGRGEFYAPLRLSYSPDGTRMLPADRRARMPAVRRHRREL